MARNAKKEAQDTLPGDGEAEDTPGRNKWQKFQLPEDMTGKSFIDVGCWEGANCAEAVRRGAKQVVGVDLCTSDELAKNVADHGFEFLQLDVLSEKWLELDTFDVVLCSGVLYHVENVISLLLRLRLITGELLVLETATRKIAEEEPLMVFRSDEEVNNPSNWWVPNKLGLYEMLKTCGFEGVKPAFERERPKGARLCVHASPVRRDSYDRVLPRKSEAMGPRGDGEAADAPAGEGWQRFQLPEDMTGKSFIDVGCGEGANCVEAVRRGAKQVVGVDLRTSDELARNVADHGFEFLQLDALSEKWLELDTFDIVLCSGALTQVENVISLLLRLRRITGELMVLETAIRNVAEEEPAVIFRPDDEAENPSNWWVPNEPGLYAILQTCGFGGVEPVFEDERPQGAQLCVRASPVRRESYDRVLPRKSEAMSLHGGRRWHELRKKGKQDRESGE